MLFAHIQYPIFDFRYFLNDEYKREIPVFPAPNANTWLRNFGHVRERKTDTSTYYLAGNYYCEAHNAVKFESLPLIIRKEKEQYEFDEETYYSEETIFDKICEFRRFRSDGNLKSCFEIGMVINPEEKDKYIDVHSDLKKILVNVKSYSVERKKRARLFELGNHICKLYEDSTSIKKTPINTIYSGRPFVVYIDYEDIDDDSNYITSHKEFYKKMKIELKHCTHNNENFWIILPLRHHYHYSKKLLASIRRALLAISLEKEALLSAYNFLLLNAGKDYINETKVLSYIKKTQEKLLRQVRFSVPQSPIVDTLFKIDFENNKAFYYDVTNLIYKVGDRYIANDFNKLFIELEFNEWRRNITKIIGTIDDKELQRQLNQLNDICIAEDKDAFWKFIYKIKDDISNGKIFLELLKGITSNYLYDLIKSYFFGV